MSNDCRTTIQDKLQSRRTNPALAMGIWGIAERVAKWVARKRDQISLKCVESTSVPVLPPQTWASKPILATRFGK